MRLLAATAALAWVLSPVQGAPTRPPAAEPGTPSGPPAAEAASRAGQPAVELEEVAFATGISSRTPVGRADAFPAGVGRVYCWNQLRIPSPPVRIKHVWHHDGRKVAEFVVDLRYRRARAWTYKTVRPGQWRVDIQMEDGTPIAVATFPVRPP